MVHRSIAGDVPIYMKLAFKVTHPFRKRRFPKLSFKSAIGLGAFWSGFSPYDSPGTLLFWCQKSMVGDAPFPLKFAFKVTHPF